MRILLVDDHMLFRKGIAALLSARPGIEVVGEAGDGLEALEQAHATMPDLVLMDVTMPRCGGLEAVLLIKRDLPHVRILMLTVSDDDRDLFSAVKNGAEGYLLKNMEPAQLYEVLDRVQQGEPGISGPLAFKILEEFRHTRGIPEEAHGELTTREIEILERVAEGATNHEIAVDLCIAENTVKIHLANILEKLHLKNRIQAAVYAVRQGFIRDPMPED